MLVLRVDDDRATWIATFERAGVPSIARMTDRRLVAVHQWFPENDSDAFDTVAVRFSDDDGRTWTTPRTIEVEGLAMNARFPFDPTLVGLDDGRLRLFFTLMIGGRTFQQATPRIASATSEDGLHWTMDEGIRFAVEDEPVIDCAVGRLDGTWHMVCPRQERGEAPTAYHAVSTDGLTFVRRDDLSLDAGFRWLGCMVTVGDSLHFYGTRHHGGPPSPGASGLPVAVSRDGSTWTLDDALAVGGADPGVVRVDDGARIVVVTGPPRAGTASDRQRPDRDRERGQRPPGRPRGGNR